MAQEYHPKLQKRFGAITSSYSSNQISLFVTAGTRGILTIAAMLGYVNSVQMDSIMSQVPAIVMAGYAAYQALDALWGLARKLLVSFFEVE